MGAAILRRTFGMAAAVALALPLIAAWHEPSIPLRLRVGATVLAAIAAVMPSAGLVLIAGLLPMAYPLRMFIRTEVSGTTIAELLTLAFLAGTVLQLAFRRPVPNRLSLPAVLLGALAAASGVVLLSGAHGSFVSPSGYLADLYRHVVFKYFVDSHDFGDLHLAFTWIEALGLAVAAESLARRDPRAGRWAVQCALVGAAVLAYYSARRLVEVSLRSPEPFAMAWRVMTSIRFNPFYTDINAAGSIYALFLVPGIWLAAIARYRLLWPAAALLALAWWLAGSRAALIGAVIGLGACWLLSRTRSGKSSWWAVGAVVAVTLIVLVPVMIARGSAPVGTAISVRGEMMQVSLRMAATEPVFGIGLGRFRPASPAFMSPEFLATGGGMILGENAHNNYLQLLAELGPAALAAFVWMLIVVMGRPAAGPDERSNAAFTALAGGILAFAITALAGHPFLTDHVRLCFFLALGHAAGLHHPAVSATPLPSRWRLVRLGTVGVLLGIIAVTLPSRVRARRDDVSLKVVVGVSAESEGPEGVIYRIAERDATWFVPGSIRAVEVPVRSDPASRAACTVQFEIDGRQADVVTAPGDGWRLVPLPLGSEPRRGPRQLTLHSPDGCRLMVGRLVVHH
jgi:O-antigen ligase/polysaccharide polymerase Wzy-like membrane protein